MLPDQTEIKKMRLELNLTQKTLAKKIGISQSFLAKIESKKEIPNYELIRKIFHLLDILKNKKLPRVSSFMTKNPITLKPKDKLTKALKILKKLGISQIPIVESSFNVGTIKESTITKSLLKFGKTSTSKILIKDVMDPPLSEIEANTPISLIYELMVNSGAVLIKDKGKIIGILTNSDLI